MTDPTPRPGPALAKLHALGNDFLVALTVDMSELPDDLPALARRLCDRRRGIGADGLIVGLIHALPGQTDMRAGPHVTMVLHNADGSRAEMSGNGIRCLAHAVARLGAPTEPLRPMTLRILTDGGLRIVHVEPDLIEGGVVEPTTVFATVSMGKVETIDEPDGWAAMECDPARPVAHLSLGNPHSVVLTDDVATVELAELGALVPHVNLEIIQPGPEPTAITMRVHERGAGITAACGTGATAAAVAAVAWGIVDGPTVLVHMDGGDAAVDLSDDEAILTGPSVHIADIVIDGLTVLT
jgi:diaminopimelate epimerase